MNPSQQRERGGGRRKFRTARARLEAIAPMLEFRRLARLGRPPLVPGLIHNMEDVASCIVRKYGISRSTLWNWYMRAQRFGCAGLVIKARSDKGKSTFFSKNPDAREFVMTRFAVEGGPVRRIYRALREWEGKPDKLPSYWTVREYLKPLVRQ